MWLSQSHHCKNTGRRRRGTHTPRAVEEQGDIPTLLRFMGGPRCRPHFSGKRARPPAAAMAQVRLARAPTLSPPRATHAARVGPARVRRAVSVRARARLSIQHLLTPRANVALPTCPGSARSARSSRSLYWATAAWGTSRRGAARALLPTRLFWCAMHLLTAAAPRRTRSKTSLMNQYVNKKFSNQYKVRGPRSIARTLRGRPNKSAARFVFNKPHSRVFPRACGGVRLTPGQGSVP